MRLDERSVHLWYVHQDALVDRHLLDAYVELLSHDERARWQRLRAAAARHAYLVAHALLRTTLSRYADVAPRRWAFVCNEHGRPEIVASPGAPPLRFSLSHTTGLVACGVALGRAIGVDVEDTRRRGGTVALADRFFSPLEVAALRELPREARRARFFEYWTLKESYLKARGVGLSLPLDRFSFHVEPDCPVRVSFDSRLPDEPASWQFNSFRPTSRHQMAVGVHRGGDPDLTVHLMATVPGRG